MIVSIVLDCIDGQNLVGEQFTESGPVTIELLELVGPGGGNPVVKVEGTAPRVLDWLLTEYTAGNLDEALEILGPNGNADRKLS